MSDKPLFRSVINWLRAGYPGGVPGPDRVPLLALLRNTPLTDDEVKEVVREITAHEKELLEDGVLNHDEIESFIEGVAHHAGNPEDISRVAAKLAAAGWPLEAFGGE
ncbi:MAG: DUF3349 domain-containing protein [Mycobacterium sp.]